MLKARPGRAPEVSAEALIAGFALLTSLCLNLPFWRVVLDFRDPASLRGFAFLLATFVCVTAIHALLFGLLGGRRLLRPALAVVWLLGVVAAFYMQRYAVFLDATMLRNVLHTQPKEALELLSPALFASVLAACAPVWAALFWVRLKAVPWPRSLLRRLGFIASAFVVALLAALAGYRDLSPLLRNQHASRFLVTPANLIVATVKVLHDDLREARRPRQPIGLDARRLRPPGATPRLLVMVVGETVRAMDWGLNGYARDTTPELARRDVINFPDVRACGSNTEVSVPCMFAPVGRRDYDEARIRGQQSLLHVLDHAGVGSLWIDNQTGCKGTCEGLALIDIRGDEDPDRCDGRICLDGVLFDLARREIDRIAGEGRDSVLVLHQLGNHGPAYSRRYPDAFRRFEPTCDNPDLDGCDATAIRNSYDNAILYTDHLLATLIDSLARREDLEAAVLYVSDHGESLGEHGLYLHGVPYAIAPDEQLRVPMALWLSPSLQASEPELAPCVAERRNDAFSHDHLFHSALGLLGVTSSEYDPTLDLFATCPRAAAAPGAVSPGAS